MPKKAGHLAEHEFRDGLLAMGEALRQKYPDVNRKAIEPLIASLMSYQRALASLIAQAGADGVLDSKERGLGYSALLERIGKPISALQVLSSVI
jgi:hypothetical protein